MEGIFVIVLVVVLVLERRGFGMTVASSHTFCAQVK